MKYSIRHYTVNRTYRNLAWFIRLLGLVCLYLVARRADAMFSVGGVRLGFTPHEVGPLVSHLGEIGILLIIASYVVEFLDHIRQTDGTRQR